MQNSWPSTPNTNDPRLVGRRYYLDRSLGEGGFAEVFYAYDTRFQPPRPVALKLLYPQLLTDPQVCRDSLEGLRARYDGPDLKFPMQVRLGRGDSAAEILRVAGEIGCGLIVMGTHGRTGLGRLLMGSVAEAVLRRATCPVLAVKASPREPAPAPAKPAEKSVTIS